MNPKEPARRRFLKNGAALAGLAVGSMRPAVAQTSAPESAAKISTDVRAYGERSHFETAIRLGAPGLYDPAPAGYHRPVRAADAT